MRSRRARRWCSTMCAGNICYDWHLGDKAAVDAAFARRGQGRQARPGQQPADPERDGAARGDRRLRPGDRRLHALHHQPEPARDPAADGRLRAAHPGEQAARRRARCRRRLRLQDLPLRRRGDRHLGGRQAAAAGQVDGRAQRKLHVRRARPRPRHPCRAGARRRTASSSALRVSTIANMGAYLSTFAPCIPTYLYATLLAGIYTTPAIYCRGQGGVHPHRAGRRLSRRRPAGGDLPAGAPRRCLRARHRHGPGRDPPEELHPGRCLPLPDAGGAAIRQRRLSGDARCVASKAADYAGFEARRSGGERRGQAARHRHLHLSRGLRHRAVGRGRLARRARRALRGRRTSGCTRPAASPS